ncbi:hypothetical protein G7054_g12043 [Neopestalotiopsis clavispora]|nr:hypothetical protein G7054_g12043 [Neopestalotiopsis clavispora]
MESEARRARKARRNPWDDDDDAEANDDELTLSATQFDARQHPMYQLEKKRAKSAFKLKSRFEDIFEKYGKDFDGVGDEIDLRTGEVIVNNGHLQSLEDEDQNKSEDEEEDDDEAIGAQRKGETKRRDENPPPSMFGSHSLLYPGKIATDPAWQTPEMQNDPGSDSPFNQGYQSPFGAPSFAMGLGPWGALGQPYKRFAAAKDVGPRAEIDPDARDHISEAEADDSGEEDALCSEVAKQHESAPRSRVKKRLEAVAVPFAGLGEVLKDSDSASNSKPSAEKSQAPRRRGGRPRKHPKKIPADTVPAESISPKPLPNASASSLVNNTVLPLRPIRTPKTADTNAVTSSDAASTAKACVRKQASLLDDSSDSQGRRSARVRKPIEHYSQLTWMKRSGIQATHVLTPPPDDNNQHVFPQSSPPRSTGQTSDILVIELPETSQKRQPQVAEDDGSTVRDSDSRKSSTGGPEASEETPNLEEPDLTIRENKNDDAQLSSSTLGRSKEVSEEPVEQSGLLLDAKSRGADAAETMLENNVSIDEDVRSDAGEKPPQEAESHGHEEADIDSNVSHDNVQTQSPDPWSNEESDGSHHGDESVELGEPVICDSDPVEIAEDGTDDMDAAQQLIAETYGAMASNLGADGEDASSELQPLAAKAVSPPTGHGDDTATDSHTEPIEQNSHRSPRSRPGKRKRQPEAETSFTRSASRPPGRPPKRISPSKPQPSTPKKTRTLASLVPHGPDDDEDELSILSSSVPTTPTSNSLMRVTFVRGASQIPSDTPTALQSRQNSALFATPRHSPYGSSRIAENHQGSPVLPRMPATDTAAVRFGLKKKRTATSTSLAQSSPLARTVLLKSPQKDKTRRRSRSIQAGGPADGIDRTPGDAARRCGKDGFVCNRDFCFTCCQ